VGIIVLEERNQSGSDRYDLNRADSDIVDLLGQRFDKLGFIANRNPLGGEGSIVIDRDVSRGDPVTILFVGCQVIDRVGEDTILSLSIWSFDEAIVIDPGMGSQRANQTGVGTFRGLDRTDSSVVAGVDVTHGESGTLSRQTTRTE